MVKPLTFEIIRVTTQEKIANIHFDGVYAIRGGF